MKLLLVHEILKSLARLELGSLGCCDLDGLTCLRVVYECQVQAFGRYRMIRLYYEPSGTVWKMTVCLKDREWDRKWVYGKSTLQTWLQMVHNRYGLSEKNGRDAENAWLLRKVKRIEGDRGRFSVSRYCFIAGSKI